MLRVRARCARARWQGRVSVSAVDLTRLAALVALGVLVVPIDAPGRASADLPSGAGADVVRARCLLCHEADLITSQRLGRAGWVREIEKMVRWGAVVSEAEKQAMADYLSGALARPAGSSAAPPSAGEIFKARCLLCHEADLTVQQRLGRAGWVREVEKMVRWGAVVSETERQNLVDWLTARHGPRR